ncbi:lipopolysaccharide biosynthesis protein [Pseudomonadota bacterium]
MLKRVLKNFGVVLRGRGIAAVFSVSAMGLMANALSATDFGLVVLLHTYIMVVRGALDFRTFDAIVRFGIPLNDSGDRAGLRSLLRSTMVIDLSSTLLATILAVAAVPLAGHFLHWDSQMMSWAAVYSLVILSTANGTPNGILRIYDRFDALSVQFTVGPALRLTMVAAAWALDAPKPVFIIAWGSAFAAGHVYMFVRGLIELRAHMNTGLWSDFSWSEVRERGGEFWKFIGVVYWQTNIDLLPKHVSVLLAGSLLGPASAGLFRLAREFSTVLTQPALMLREVLFPDLTRSFHAEDGHFHSVPFKTALVAGSIGLLFVLVSVFFGGDILGIVGEEYVAASTLLSLLLLAASFDLASASLRAAAYAMGRAGSILRIHIVGIITYIAMFFLLTPLTGLTGPGLAAILASLLALILTVRLIAKN